jgi:hypothetical protein
MCSSVLDCADANCPQETRPQWTLNPWVRVSSPWRPRIGRDPLAGMLVDIPRRVFEGATPGTLIMAAVTRQSELDHRR